jgi:hypothetical protein
VEPTYSIAPQAEAVSTAQPGVLLKSVFALYRSKFSSWFGITAPTSMLATTVVWMADQRIKATFRNIPFLELSHHRWEIAGALTIRYCSYFLSWLLGCFALAAIATVVSGLNGDEDEGTWRTDSHQAAREHFGKLALVGLFTFCAFLAGLAIAGFVAEAVVRVGGRALLLRFNFGIVLVGYVAVASVVSWLGMAIPLILRNSGVWAALKRSLELSNGYEGALLWLVVQSSVGSCLAVYGIYYGFRSIFPVPLQYTLWYGWLVFIVAVLAGAAIEPPIFIGFSLLADPEQFRPSSFPRP